MPRPGSQEFCDALAGERFTSIETSASEETSIGWVTPGDPTGETFEAQDMDYDAGFWLRVRVDKKKLSSKWVSIYRAGAEKSRGRPLTRRERQELTTDLKEKLLPRLLPTVNLIDVLYFPNRDRLLLFATGAGVRDAFVSLFQRTFSGAHLLPADPHQLARSSGLDREQTAYLDQVTPIRWPRDGVTPAAKPIAAPEPIETAMPAVEIANPEPPFEIDAEDA